MKTANVLTAFAASSAPVNAFIANGAGAPMVDDNPKEACHVAEFPQGGSDKIAGYVTFTSYEGIAKVSVELASIINPDGGFSYHIHEKPLENEDECACYGTGEVLNPFNGTSNCADVQDKSLCKVGDLSGKYGQINSNLYQAKYLDPYLGLYSSSPSFIGERSITIHKSDGTRIACADIVPCSEKKVTTPDCSAPVPSVPIPEPALEPPTKEPPTKAPPAKEPPAKEPPTKEPPAKEPPAKEPPAKEPPAKEPPAKEPVAEPSTETPCPPPTPTPTPTVEPGCPETAVPPPPAPTVAKPPKGEKPPVEVAPPTEPPSTEEPCPEEEKPIPEEPPCSEEEEEEEEPVPEESPCPEEEEPIPAPAPVPEEPIVKKPQEEVPAVPAPVPDSKAPEVNVPVGKVPGKELPSDIIDEEPITEEPIPEGEPCDEDIGAPYPPVVPGREDLVSESPFSFTTEIPVAVTKNFSNGSIATSKPSGFFNSSVAVSATSAAIKKTIAVSSVNAGAYVTNGFTIGGILMFALSLLA